MFKGINGPGSKWQKDVTLRYLAHSISHANVLYSISSLIFNFTEYKGNHLDFLDIKPPDITVTSEPLTSASEHSENNVVTVGVNFKVVQLALVLIILFRCLVCAESKRGAVLESLQLMIDIDRSLVEFVRSISDSI